MKSVHLHSFALASALALSLLSSMCGRRGKKQLGDTVVETRRGRAERRCSRESGTENRIQFIFAFNACCVACFLLANK